MTTQSATPVYSEYIPLQQRIAFKCRISSRRRAWLEQQHARNPRCHYCRNMTTLEHRTFNQTTESAPGSLHATLDHLVPLSRGGKDQPSNYRLACYTCNYLKGTMCEKAFIKELVRAGVR